ncbi:hypothetical protein OB13_16070 [Pontibacter sp. HJ8]
MDESTTINIISLVLNIACSVTASLLFLFILLFIFRPHIKVSPFVCRSPSKFEDDKTVYFIKVVNHSFFPAYDIKVNLQILEKYPVPPAGMMNTRMRPLELVSYTHSHLVGYRPSWWRKQANHCIRFRTFEDLDSIVKDDMKSVEVQVTLKHGLSGLVKVFSEEYSDKSQIKGGTFSYGTKFGVLN